MRTRRLEKINSLVKETVAESISELATGDLGMMTVTRVEVTPDLREAKIFVEFIGDEKTAKTGLEFLEDNKSKIQAKVARLELKYTPVLRFIDDKGSENLVRIEQLLDLNDHGKT